MNNPYSPENNFTNRINKNSVYVFGSNPGGWHGGGAARYLFDKGVIEMNKHAIGYSKTSSQTAGSYGINTMSDIDDKDYYSHGSKAQILTHIQEQTHDFINFANANPDKNFIVLPYGVSIAGHDPKDVVKPFIEKGVPGNLKLPKMFKDAIYGV